MYTNRFLPSITPNTVIWVGVFIVFLRLDVSNHKNKGDANPAHLLANGCLWKDKPGKCTPTYVAVAHTEVRVYSSKEIPYRPL